MTPQRRYRLIAAGVAGLLVGLLAAWFFSTYRRVEREVTLPPRGEARFNPLFGLKRTLEARKIETVSRADFNFTALAPESGDLLLLDIDLRSLSDAQTDELLQWVEDGGHLALRLPQGDEGRPGELLERLGLTVAHEFSCMSWDEALACEDPGAPKSAGEVADAVGKAAANRSAGMYCSSYRFRTAAEYESDFDWLWGNGRQGFVFGRHPWGDGDVLIAADFDFLHNTALKDGGNAALAWQLLGPVLGEGRALLVYATNSPPWYVLLVRHGRYVLLPLLLALLAWLAAQSQRFGPLQPLAPRHQRAVLAHVQAAGEFAFAR
ncbi:DUF4350 domain-containing protein, partial [Tahibacter caeni]|uniref:DUF4350 domain-containing protein n=1 Tax=Tahibacter caeni TaxID=1453545 RepID=UPI0021475741